ncbi:aldehyde dehydrogenase [Calocera viscosa TUFC12733]|uniref:Aldehyde dehydrogenase n=1 Tax=Calocera viscosa (strain TUFC12733) TaxID=1330018 RepID=A0A167J331_CALVF|nr:aldehyde dehydrogenase [Calocera viscosa TUFC12733]
MYRRYTCSPGVSPDHSIPVEDPATGETLCYVYSTQPRQVREAIVVADETFRSGVWSRASPAHRAKVLTDISRALSDNLEDFIQTESLQTGRCIREMRAQLVRVPEWLDYHAALARTHQGLVLPTQGNLLNYVKRYPLGVVAQITPFNHPLLIAMKKIAPALAAGNSVIVKPSELAPITVLKFAELANRYGLPSGVLAVLPGQGKNVGSLLALDKSVRKVDITAGTVTGRSVSSLVAPTMKSYTAELGGKAPIIVFSDADIPSAVAGTCFSAFVASGQTCVSGTRLLVQEDIAVEFMRQLVGRLDSITQRIGSPQNPASMMGPVISADALKRLEEAIERLDKKEVTFGGKRLTGPSPLDGTDLSKGYFFSPTVVSLESTECEAWEKELFGPILTLVSFKTEEEAVKLANDSEYALGAGIFTSSLDRAHRVAELVDAGVTWVNTWHRNDPSSPWGGWKAGSGIGRENGVEAFESYTQSKSVIINLGSAEERKADDWFADGADGTGKKGPRYG